MKLEKWALVAEIVSAVAIVASLVFVGIQVRQAENAVKGQVYQDLVGQIASLNFTRIEDAQFADIFARYVAGEELPTIAEQQRMQAYTATLFRLGDVAYRQHLNGMIDEPGLLSVLSPVTVAFNRSLEREVWVLMSPNLSEAYVRYMQEIVGLCERFPVDALYCDE